MHTDGGAATRGTALDPRGRQLGVLTLVALVAIAVAYVSWPRPDAIIHIARGGVATVQGAPWQRTLPLGDTVVVGGSGRRTLRLVNDDTMPHQIAMFRAPMGTSTSYRVPPGVYGGMCSAHPTKRPITFIAR